MHDADIAVIGAGVVGLAIARRMATTASVIVLEKNARPGLETSGRNSGVIHAGIYYPADSLKTRLCVQGRALLYEYCEQRQIPYQRCGKLIVATNTNEESALQTLQQQANANGVALQWWNQAQVQREESALHARAALFSPDSGIIDTTAYLLQLAADAQRHDADTITHCSVERITPHTDGFDIATRSDDVEHTLRVKQLVNAAGLHAQTLAQRTDGLDTRHIPPLHRCKGDYFRYAKAAPFTHLIYPVADKNAAGLGIHATLDLQGSLRFGPDVEYTDTESFAVSENKRELFCNAIQRYFPALNADDLIPDFAGIRPKLQAPGAAFCDFAISGKHDHGIAGLVNLFGIESPGLTASLAIADHVASLLH